MSDTFPAVNRPSLDLTLLNFIDLFFASICCQYALLWLISSFREFAKTVKRPFTVRYNPYTQSVDVLKDTTSINCVVEELRHELDIVGDALNRLNKHSGVWITVPVEIYIPLYIFI